jgi:hypothetical protein
MQTSKLVAQLMVAGVLAIATLGITKAVAEDEPGSCGEYKYWKDGGCVDAREKPAAAWTDSMTKRPVW